MPPAGDDMMEKRRADMDGTGMTAIERARLDHEHAQEQERQWAERRRAAFNALVDAQIAAMHALDLREGEVINVWVDQWGEDAHIGAYGFDGWLWGRFPSLRKLKADGSPSKMAAKVGGRITRVERAA